MRHRKQCVGSAKVADGSFASILPCPLFLPLSTTPDITTARTRAPTKVWDRRQDKSDGVAPCRRGSQVFVCILFWMALQRHRMKRPGAARTKKAFKINVSSAIVRSVASCCACPAGCAAMIAWEAAAGPTVHRQGWRFARPAPPACGLDCAPLARLFAAMRSWLAVRDCAQAAEEARGRSTAA